MTPYLPYPNACILPLHSNNGEEDDTAAYCYRRRQSRWPTPYVLLQLQLLPTLLPLLLAHLAAIFMRSSCCRRRYCLLLLFFFILLEEEGGRRR
jgi:hypothetical protein